MVTRRPNTLPAHAPPSNDLAPAPWNVIGLVEAAVPVGRPALPVVLAKKPLPVAELPIKPVELPAGKGMLLEEVVTVVTGVEVTMVEMNVVLAGWVTIGAAPEVERVAGRETEKCAAQSAAAIPLGQQKFLVKQ